VEIGGYRIVGELGRGGMGVVYEAVDPRSQRRVALKTVGFDGQRVSPRGLERLRREADALTRLAHPGLAPCLGSGVGPRGYYVTMELVEGTSLEALLQREGPLPLGRALRIMEDVGEALAYVHEQGLLHRDVKPANVLLSNSGRVVLTDFGLVKLSPELQQASQASLTRSGAVLGTPGYLPPEQAFGEGEHGTAADVYGWGATLYALLSGGAPRAGRTVVEVLASFSAPVASLRDARPDVPEWLDRLLARCLANEPGERPRLREALRELRGFGGPAAPSGSRRTVLGVAAVAAVGLGLGLLAVLGGVEGASPEEQPPPTADGEPPPVETPGAHPSPSGSDAQPVPDPPPDDDVSGEELVARFWARLAAGDYAGALAETQAALARDPDAANWLELRGALRLQHLDDDGGIDDLLRALELGIQTDGEVLLQEVIVYYTKHEQPQALLDLLDRYFAGSTAPTVRMARAEACLELGLGEQALELTTALVQEAPKARYVLDYGRALVLVGRVADGLSAIERLYSLGPESGELYQGAVIHAARLSLGAGARHLDVGRRAIARWLELEPNHPEPLSWRLTIWVSERPGEVEAESARLLPLARAAGDSTALHRIHQCRGIVFLAEGRHDEARAEAEAALTLFVSGTSLALRGQILRLQGNLEAAERDLRGALEESPRLASAWVQLALVLQGRDDVAGAREAARRVLALPATEAEVALARRVLAELRGR